jgi:Xaa-Pro aminopeptidase
MFIKVGRKIARMGELLERRRRLFKGAAFSSALFFSGGSEGAGFSYFAGCDVDGACLVLKKGRGELFTHEMNYAEAKEDCPYPVRLFGKNPWKALKKACGGGKVGFSPSSMSAARYLALKKKAKLRLVDAGEKIAKVRGSKSGSEMQKIASSARVAKKILAGLDPWKSRTEAELASRLKMLSLREGCETAFEPIVATGKNSSRPHHKPGRTRLGDFVLVDFGVKKEGYCSDFTRCYLRRKGMEEEKEYEKCRSVYRDLLRALPDCKNGRDVCALSEKLMKKHGLPALIHAIGHGVGMEVHEPPHFGKKSRDSLSGAVLAIEPAAYFKRFGVRYEGMVAHRNGKWKSL